MRKFPTTVQLAVCAVALALAPAVHAQVTGGAVAVTAPGQAGVARTVSATATVSAIDLESRRVTLRRADGTAFDVIAGEEVRNLPYVRVGDEVTLEYVEALTLELRKGGTGAPASRTDVLAAGRAEAGARPGGAAGREVRIVADVIAVDASAQTVSLRGPAGRVVVLPVRDPEQFKRVAVGDQVEVTYTEALALAVTPVARTGPEYRAFLFAWASGIDGRVTARNPFDPGQQVRVNFDWDFGNLIDDLDATFMIYGDARFGSWSVFGDYTYTKVSPSSEANRLPNIDRIDTELKTQIGQLAVGYAMWEDQRNRQNRVELYGGARYYWTRNDVVFRSGPNDLDSRSKDDWVDGVVGVRVFWELAPRWVAVGQLDGGWGGSDHSIQAWAYAGYQFDWGSVGAGWRYLNYKRDHRGVTNDLSYSGPLIGVTAKF